ncbi:MAG: c-type cytochrome [Myxococcota bacterium]|nr:c-type cytochrome [Myxococcota bacterium]
MRRMRMGALAASVALLALGCDSMPGKPDEAERYVQPDKITDFDYLYQKTCSGCHGADGTLGPARPLNDPLYLAVAGESDLIKSITYGQEGTAMPPFAASQGGPLAEIQVEAIAKGLIAKWGGTPPKGPLPPHTEAESIAAGHLPGNAAEGAVAYKRYCGECHGEEGTGGKIAGSVVDGSFLALVSNQGLRTTVIAGRTDLGMPSYRDHTVGSRKVAMSPQEISDVVAWLASQRRAFPGQTYPEASAVKARAASKEKS